MHVSCASCVLCSSRCLPSPYSAWQASFCCRPPQPEAGSHPACQIWDHVWILRRVHQPGGDHWQLLGGGTTENIIFLLWLIKPTVIGKRQWPVMNSQRTCFHRRRKTRGLVHQLWTPCSGCFTCTFKSMTNILLPLLINEFTKPA